MNTTYQVSEVKLTYKPKVKASERMGIYSSNDTYQLLKENFYDADTIEYRESFKIVLLNRANKVLGVTQVSEGGLNSTPVDIRIIMQAAILANASAIILSHNHPSGNLRPSSDDKSITAQINQAAKIMQLQILDHIILTSEDYYSFADEGLI